MTSLAFDSLTKSTQKRSSAMRTKFISIFSVIALGIWGASALSAADDCKSLSDCAAKLSDAAHGMNDKIEAIFAEIDRQSVPIGTIITSALPPDKFASEGNPQYHASKWVIADGRAISANSRYAKLTGKTSAPDLRFMSRQKLVMDIITGNAKSGQNIKQLQSPEFYMAQWHFQFGLRDISGNRANNDFEQDVDNFQIVPDSGVVIAQGRTLNWKHGQWGGWSPGSVNYMGIATMQSEVFYYVKID